MKTKHNLNNRFEPMNQIINFNDLFSKEDLTNERKPLSEWTINEKKNLNSIGIHSIDESFHERLIQISDEFKKSNSSQFSDVVSEIDELIDKLSRNDFNVKVTPNFLLHNQYMYEVTTFDFLNKYLNKETEKPRSRRNA